jgi:hypothetical protein
MRDHLLVSPGAGGRWRLNGLIDVGPATRGATEYGFAGVASSFDEPAARRSGAA